MKKIQYIAPAIEVTRLTVENVIAGSPTSITGADGLGVGGNTSDANVTSGNTKGSSDYNVWNDDWSK